METIKFSECSFGNQTLFNIRPVTKKVSTNSKFAHVMVSLRQRSFSWSKTSSVPPHFFTTTILHLMIAISGLCGHLDKNSLNPNVHRYWAILAEYTFAYGINGWWWWSAGVKEFLDSFHLTIMFSRPRYPFVKLNNRSSMGR